MSAQWRENRYGLGLCFIIALLSYWLGDSFQIVGGAVFALLIGMLLASLVSQYTLFQSGIAFTSKKILQLAVVLLGFGLNLSVLLQIGQQSLPIILSTISVALLVAYVGFRFFGIPSPIAVLVGVGSSICGGSAIAATAPVIEAEDEDVAQAISVIFFFNVLAALLFPILGKGIGFASDSGAHFGLFAGTAINDTSSVTAAASTWDTMYGLGSQTLDTAVTVKLTRTLAIIPITMILSYWRSRSRKMAEHSFSIRHIFPTFILFFLLASVLTTVASNLGVSDTVFQPIKVFSKFFIMMAMAAVGLKTDLMKLVKNGQGALILGFMCWLCISLTSLLFQALLGLI